MVGAIAQTEAMNKNIEAEDLLRTSEYAASARNAAFPTIKITITILSNINPFDLVYIEHGIFSTSSRPFTEFGSHDMRVGRPASVANIKS